MSFKEVHIWLEASFKAMVPHLKFDEVIRTFHFKENEMEKMPKEDLETQLSLLYEIEEKIRNKQEYDISKQNDYFSKITKDICKSK